MKTHLLVVSAAVLLAARPALTEDQAHTRSLRRAVPADVYMAVYAKHNPERDYQREHYAEVWRTVQETRIIERAVKIVTSLIPEDDLDEAKSVLGQVREAAEPIKLEALVNCKESVYAQKMQGFTAHHLVALRLGSDAANWEKGIKNLMALAAKLSNDAIPVLTSQQGEVTVTTMGLPDEAQYKPSIARVDDVLLFASSEKLVRQSVKLMVSGEGKSKFDDPRLKEALAQLPKPEDSLFFYDGKLQFKQLRGMGDFIRQVSGGDPGAARAAAVMEKIFDQLAIFDYEVTVEYTEGNQNRTASYGKVLPGIEDKLLYQALGSGEPFENWESWVPAEALSYSLHTGINLHPIYEGVMKLIKEEFPEAEEGLAHFEQMQENLGVHLDGDIFQSFSGECVMVTLPAAESSIFGNPDTVVAMRCHKPKRIREVLQMAVGYLQNHPFTKSQQIRVTKCEHMKGFYQVSAVLLRGFGLEPVIGFRDGWMFVGTNASAVEQVLKARAGQIKTIVQTDAFKRFKLKVEGPVTSISYTNLAETTRTTARMLSQAGAMAHLIIGFIGLQQDSEELKPVQELLALMPDLAKIVAKFDFLEEQISVTQGGDDPTAYVRKSVILVRPRSGG